MNSNVFTLLTVAVLVTTTAAMVSPIPNSDSGSTKFSIMHLTDVHGWINGHPHNETLNTDFGHLASFLSHMKAKAEADKSEFFLFDSGDLIEGTGLSDATPVHGTNIFKITEQLEQSYDGMTIGNHDIGHPETVELMQQKNGFIDAMKGKYLTSNAFDKKTQDPLGNFYRVIDSAQGHRILVLGFIFNFDQNANNTVIVNPVDSVKQDWFKEAMNVENVDVIVTLNHIDPQGQKDQLEATYNAIRAVHADKPLILLSGHRHVLYFEQYDDQAFTLESGKYMQHYGWIEFTLSSEGKMEGMTHQWFDTNLQNYLTLADVSEDNFETPLGQSIRKQMSQMYQALDLGKVYGCSPQTFDPSVDLHHLNSFYALWIDHIFPYLFNESDSGNVQFGVSNTASLRSPMYKGPVTKDDMFTISPFADTYSYFPAVSGTDMQKLVEKLKTDSKARVYRNCPYQETDDLGPWVWSYQIDIKPDANYRLVAANYDCFKLQAILQDLFPSQQWPYTAYPVQLNSVQLLQYYLEAEMPC
eukprot:TRINITY_DN6966_c0_g1_i3.p1 TRINITY_DN6966_c0_g1~~TRINITY_DN6966_c0_g1_i3.p1  ORF type:complete len:555 (+),score=155.56 TRINITY_DN6966_c0_g1_i3:86-1666(+)